MSSRHAIAAARKDGGLDPWVRLGKWHPVNWGKVSSIKLRHISHLNCPLRWPGYSPKSMGGMCCGSRENATVISLWQHLKSIFCNKLQAFKYNYSKEDEKQVCFGFDCCNYCRSPKLEVLLGGVSAQCKRIHLWFCMPLEITASRLNR